MYIYPSIFWLRDRTASELEVKDVRTGFGFDSSQPPFSTSGEWGFSSVTNKGGLERK